MSVDAKAAFPGNLRKHLVDRVVMKLDQRPAFPADEVIVLRIPIVVLEDPAMRAMADFVMADAEAVAKAGAIRAVHAHEA